MSVVSDPGMSDVIECAICLDRCVNGVRLQCLHVFCFLCAKGSAQQSSHRCPVCRHPIAHDYFDSPDLIGGVEWTVDQHMDEQHMSWQYEGRNGWWLYDCRTSRDIQTAFKANESSVEVLIAGFVYVIDFERMIQFRRNEPNRIRRIQRQPLDPNTTKGVAGLRTQFSDTPDAHSSSDPVIDANESECLDAIVATSGAQSETHEDNCESSDREAKSDEMSALEQRFAASVDLQDTTKETYL